LSDQEKLNGREIGEIIMVKDYLFVKL
jgi:hypothetical protein